MSAFPSLTNTNTQDQTLTILRKRDIIWLMVLRDSIHNSLAPRQEHPKQGFYLVHDHQKVEKKEQCQRGKGKQSDIDLKVAPP